MKVLNFIVALLIIAILAIGCSETSKKELSVSSFFDFNEAHYYSSKISWDSVESIYNRLDNSIGTQRDQQIADILGSERFHNLSDTASLSNLSSLGFVHKEIPDLKLDHLNSIFSYNQYDDYRSAACEPVFRDVFIFKKGNKIKGAAKICFDCQKQIFIGNKFNSNSFNQGSEYKRLLEFINLIN